MAQQQFFVVFTLAIVGSFFAQGLEVPQVQFIAADGGEAGVGWRLR